MLFQKKVNETRYRSLFDHRKYCEFWFFRNNLGVGYVVFENYLMRVYKTTIDGASC